MALSKLPIPPSHFVALAGYDPTGDAWYPVTINPATGAITQQQAASNVDSLAHGQVTIDFTGDLIVAARAGRDSVVIVNHGSVNVFLGNQNVNADNGLLLGIGQSITVPGSAAVYGKTASGSQIVSYMEVF